MGKKFGAPARTRTWNPLIKSQLLYQLSYRGTVPKLVFNFANPFPVCKWKIQFFGFL